MKPVLSNKKLTLLIISLILALLCVIFIFSNSLKDGAESSEQSSSVYELVNDVTDALGFKNHVSHALVRNLAHIAEFALLGVFLSLALALLLRVDRSYSPLRTVLKLLPAAIICTGVAIIDEFIQFGSEGRAPQVSDALLDVLGTLIGISVFFAAFVIYRAKCAKKHNDETASA